MPEDKDKGQVSEVNSLDGAGEPIVPDQAVAGAPDAESGEVQEGKAGPNARTGREESDGSVDPTADEAADHR